MCLIEIISYFVEAECTSFPVSKLCDKSAEKSEPQFPCQQIFSDTQL